MNDSWIYVQVIAIMAIITYLLRALPFLLWSHQSLPKSIAYLGKGLPYAMMALLVVYCFRNTSVANFPFGIPEMIAGTSTVLLYRWKRNNMIAILGSTMIYMFLVQVIF